MESCHHHMDEDKVLLLNLVASEDCLAFLLKSTCSHLNPHPRKIWKKLKDHAYLLIIFQAHAPLLIREFDMIRSFYVLSLCLTGTYQ
jgi:hypothetical protein